MKHILILNFARMGDLIEAIPIAEGLKKAYPQARVAMAINRRFEGICRGDYPVDQVIPLDLDSCVNYSRNESSLVDRYRHLAEILLPLRKVRYDLIINLSHTLSSGMFTRLLEGKDIRGFTLDRNGRPFINHPWMQYFWTMSQNRRLNTFNIVDVHVMSAGLSPERLLPFFEVSAKEYELAEDIIRQAGVGDQDLLIGFQPGANDDLRRWPASSFSALAECLQKEFGARICLFGVESEKKLGEEICSRVNSHVINLIGQTSIPQLAALLKRCRLLISNDTGTMHMAAAVGTQVVTITLAHAYTEESAPYSPGLIIIRPTISCFPCEWDFQCQNPVCKQHILTEEVLECVRMILKGEEMDRTWDAESFPFHSIHLYRTAFDRNNLLELKPLTRLLLTEKDCLQLLYREMWLRSLTPERSKEPFSTDEWVETIQNHYSLSSVPAVSPQLEIMKEDFHELAVIAQQGVELLENILRQFNSQTPDQRIVEKAFKHLSKLDEEIEQHGFTTYFLRPLSQMFQFQKESVQEKSFQSMSEGILQVYRDLHWRADFMKQAMSGLESSLRCPPPSHNRDSAPQENESNLLSFTENAHEDLSPFTTPGE